MRTPKLDRVLVATKLRVRMDAAVALLLAGYAVALMASLVAPA